MERFAPDIWRWTARHPEWHPGKWGAEVACFALREGARTLLVDPLVLEPDAGAPRTGPIEGFLVGPYFVERDLLSWRRLIFPNGVALGDLIVFPNTAGYLMHLLESRSHQIPLARNLILPLDGSPFLDSVDV